MERIRVIETNTIIPATYKPEYTPRKIDFTPWDLQFLLLGCIQRGILFSSSPPDLVNLLKTSLSYTLDYFYPLAGRLRFVEDFDKDAKMYYIECNNAGVEFVEAVAENVTVAHILESEYDFGIIHMLFPQNGLLNIECDVNPFFAVKVTELACGGCFIGCTLSHMFADGSSFWNFMNSWSEICRGYHSTLNSPVLDRRYPLQYKVWIPNELIKKPANKSPSILKESIFHLPKEKIASLKLKSIAESGNQKISSLQAVLAHIWRAVSRSQELDTKNDLHFTIAIGHRTRTEPNLPTHYFGNALHLTTVSLKCEEILAECGLGKAACELNKLVSLQTESLVMDFISSWIENPTLLGLGAVFSCNSLVASSSPKFDVYGNDFGWGRPVAVRSGGGNKDQGKITIFGGAEDGSMDIEVCLLAATMDALQKDTELVCSATKVEFATSLGES